MEKQTPYITIENMLVGKISQSVTHAFSGKYENINSQLLRIAKKNNSTYDLQYVSNLSSLIANTNLNNMEIINNIQNLEDRIQKIISNKNISEIIISKFNPNIDKYTIYY